MLRRLPGLCLVALVAAALAANPGAAKPPDLPDNPPIHVAPEARQAVTTTILYNVHPISALAPAVCPCPQQACQPAQSCPHRSVMENLQALEKASALLAQARQFAAHGRPNEARECLELVRALVPGSCCAQRAAEAFAEMADDAVVAHQQAAQEPCHTAWFFPLAQMGHCWAKQACAKFQQFAADYPVHAKMQQPVTARWTSVPLGAVLADLDRMHGTTIVMEPGVCLDVPVSLDVAGKPLAAVFEMLARPFGLEPCVQGECVYLNGPRCATGEECCEDECCAKACQKCEEMHVKHAKKVKVMVKCARPGVEEQVKGLMKACYLAIEEGRYGKATDLAREAHALDPRRVEGDPLVYKFGLVGEKVSVKGCQVDCCASKSPCCPSCPCKSSNGQAEKPIAAKKAKKGSVSVGVGVSSNAGLTGTVVVNGCPYENAKCAKGCSECCSTCSQGCCGVKVKDACAMACKMLKEMCFAPMVPPDDGKGTLTLGMSSAGQVNAFCRAHHEGVVYNVLFKDGIFLLWMTPQTKAK